MPRKAKVEEVDKKSRLTLAQLAAYDDVSTDVMIDQVSRHLVFSNLLI